VRVSTDPLIIIKQARLLDSDELHTITLRDGVVDSITPSRRADKTHTANSIVNADMPDALCIDANDQIAVPGMCDLYARLREPGLTRKGSIASESYAALTAGFTRVLCSPDTQPAIDSVATVQLIKQRAEMAQGAQIFPIAALTVGLAGEQLSELATLQAAGCPVASQADS
jgi:dihydroorotase